MSAPTKAPKPGRPVRGSRTGRPVMALLDLLGRRWALRILWELREDRSNFRSLLERIGGNSGALNERIKELREAGIVDHSEGDGYGLTPEGKKLLENLAPLHQWAERWAKRQR